MVDLHGREEAPAATPRTMSSEKRQLLSTAMKRTSEWISSLEVPTDVAVHVGDASFSLHKFPLVSKCGYIRRLMAARSANHSLSVIELRDLPGGSKVFELVVKFCYGVDFEVTIQNIAVLRCAAEHLEMTEEFAERNLVHRTEAYLNSIALKSLPSAISVLAKAETLVPVSEKVKLVTRCIDAVAYLGCKQSQLCVSDTKEAAEWWWAEDLTMLGIDTFRRVLAAMTARGLDESALASLLMLYAEKFLRALESFDERKNNHQKEAPHPQEHKTRLVLETITSLIPRETSVVPVSFLSTLLRAAINLDTTIACRLHLERRIALQLTQAAPEDLLFPSCSCTTFDADTVLRIMKNYNESKAAQKDSGSEARTREVLEKYLAEIASDRNLCVEKFASLAELVRNIPRPVEDGMYGAVDIYLKAHPIISALERKKLSDLIDYRKLSREAWIHAAQNERLHDETVIQALSLEQKCLRDAAPESLRMADAPPLPRPTMGRQDPITADLAMRKENEELKLEVLRLKSKLKATGDVDSDVATGKMAPLWPRSKRFRMSFVSSISKKLGWFLPFSTYPNTKFEVKPNRSRRHSIS